MKKPTFALRQLILPQLPLWVVSLVLAILTVVSVLGLVMASGWLVGTASMATMTAVVLGSSYALSLLLIRVFALSRTLARYGELMVSHHAVFALLGQLRVQFFAQWVNLPSQARHQSGQSSTQKMHRLVKDIDVLNEFVLRLVLPCVVSLVAVVLMAFCVAMFIGVQALWVFVPIVLVLVVLAVAMGQSKGQATQESTLIESRKTALLDTLPALVQLVLWGRWQDTVIQLGKLDATHHALMQKNQRQKRRLAFVVQMGVAGAVVILLCVIQLIFTHQTKGAGLTPAVALALLLGVFGLFEMLMALAVEPLALGRSLLAKDHLNELITPHVAQNKNVFVWDRSPLTLTLSDFSVKMPNAVRATTPLNATITTNKPTLIMGASGVGKSTLLATLAGEVPAFAGRALLNEQDLQGLDLSKNLVLLGQRVDIFDQTLADNLRLGKIDATDEELLAVLESVNLTSWLKSQPKGLATPLGEYGMAVSGGQARRIALARLLLGDRAVVLLDEPFAGLDKDTCQKVYQALVAKQQSGQIGLLIIATHQYTDDMKDTQILTIT